MSFAALAVRTCLIQALRGQTLAGDRVLDDPSDPVGLAVSSDAPVVAVSSVREVTRPRGRRCGTRERPCARCCGDPDASPTQRVDLALALFVPVDCVAPVPGMSGAQIDVRRCGTGFAFDLMGREIIRALALEAAPAPGGAWADLWRRAVNGVVAVKHGPYDGAPDARVSARRIVMRLDALDEPAFGALRSDFWPDFVAAAKTCPDLADVAPVIEGAVAGDDLPGWRALAALLGLGPDDMVPLGLGPLGGGPADPIVPLAAAAVDGRDPDAPDGALAAGAP